MSSRDLATPVRRASVSALLSARTWPLVVWAAMAGWWAALFSTARADFVNFRLAKFDLGNMTQAVWSTAHGRPLEVTLTTGEQGIRLGGHVDPILVFLAPLWIVAPTPLMLPALQIAVVALGALPVFWLGRRHIGSEKLGALAALSYLAYPWLAFNALDQFHPVTIAIPLLLFALWFLDNDRLGAFAVCAVLAALCGELIGVTVAALGVWYAVTRRRRPGILIAFLGAAWSAVALTVVVPVFSGGSSAFYGYYESVGGSPIGLFRTAVTDPATIGGALADVNDVRYVLALALPLAGAFLLSPGLAAVALPQLLANMLSDASIMTSPSRHYVSVAIPFLMVATVFGVARLSEARRGFATKLVLACCVAFSAVFGAWPEAPGGVRPELSKVEALRAAVALVPNDAPVSATNRVASHLSARRYVYTVPTVDRAEWIVVDASDTWIPWSVGGREQPERLGVFIRELEASRTWDKLFERDGVLVFRKMAT